jgi:hypothetical protein
LEILPEAKDGIFTQRFPDGSEVVRHQPKPELTVGKVCDRNCNNGWMSAKLEGPMKSATAEIILKNTRKVFSASECKTIAAWAFKTTVLANHMYLRRDEQPLFSYKQRRSFARDLSIPPGVQVWIAQRNAGYVTARYMSTLRIMEPPPSTNSRFHNIPLPVIVFRFTTAYFPSVIFCCRSHPQGGHSGKSPIVLIFPPLHRVSSLIAKLFPFGLRLDLSNGPPPSAVGNNLFPIFCERFKDFTLPWWT